RRPAPPQRRRATTGSRGRGSERQGSPRTRWRPARACPSPPPAIGGAGSAVVARQRSIASPVPVFPLAGGEHLAGLPQKIAARMDCPFHPAFIERGELCESTGAAGVAGGLLAPLLCPAVARNARPAARKALKAGIVAVERGRVVIAEFAEHASDLVAEARAEHDVENKPSTSEPAVSVKEVVRLRGSGRETSSP